mgnify:CR=1 FL=1
MWTEKLIRRKTMDKNTKTTKKEKKRHSIFGNLVFLLADILNCLLYTSDAADE